MDFTTPIMSYIINIENSTDYDIDIPIPFYEKYKYINVIKNFYKYKEISNEELINADLESIETQPILTGTMYRCRLKEIGINKGPYQNRKINNLTNIVKKQIDSCNGIVKCNIYEVDKYNRLLVDIFIEIGDCDVNLKDFILEYCENDPNPVYYSYIEKQKFNIKK